VGVRHNRRAQARTPVSLDFAAKQEAAPPIFDVVQGRQPRGDIACLRFFEFHVHTLRLRFKAPRGMSQLRDLHRAQETGGAALLAVQRWPHRSQVHAQAQIRTRRFAMPIQKVLPR
jgi:hypothetical protein